MEYPVSKGFLKEVKAFQEVRQVRKQWKELEKPKLFLLSSSLDPGSKTSAYPPLLLPTHNYNGRHCLFSWIKSINCLFKACLLCFHGEDIHDTAL